VHLLLVHDEGDDAVLEGVPRVVDRECASATRLEPELVDHWFEHRNDVAALEALTRRGFVVDTIEVAGRWSALPAMYEAATAAIKKLPGALVASAHQSHAYSDGACLYFTFAGQPAAHTTEAKEAFYR